ncbi:tRNA(Ile)-lysidine synthase [endosymbiont of Euscepes postfasciatus]|uniref:tRNA lysidine(34) synthetase TilS n=1 Tax=endosymbiont of Euscepes postfasciatus TaxID=650377 RepID=UPI000DC716FD|nr:tRNA lysidine(34) synthetase TilS [endosymbiont of Euscepes postfasciatus]BBA84567.1 tRNA(Ile)-lysidine synthase [endosymbiont of Euscepes postfasciatus]
MKKISYNYFLNKIENEVFNKIKFYIKKFNLINFVVLFSGGLDSTVLIYIFNKIKNICPINIKVLHINHNINNNSILYSNHCLNFCKKLNLKIKILNININKELIKKFGYEYSYRISRLNIIKKNINKKNDILVTAHHKNDQIETLFLFLDRISGLNGLSGIKSYNKIFNIKIIRPLLKFKKIELFEYIKKNNIQYIYDITNKDINIKRNFIRHKLISNIENIYPKFIDSIYKSMIIINNQYLLLYFLIKKNLKKILNNDKKILDIKIIKKNIYNEIHFFYLIKDWLSKIYNIYINIKKSNIIYKKILYDDNINNKKITSLQINNNNFIIKYNNFFHLIKKPRINKRYILLYKENNILYLPENMGHIIFNKNINEKNKNYIYTKVNKNFFYEKITIQFFTISFKEKVFFHKNKIKIKDIFNKYKIPYLIRKQIPLLFYNEKLISILNLFVINNINNKNNDFIYIKWFNSPIKKYLYNII